MPLIIILVLFILIIIIIILSHTIPWIPLHMVTREIQIKLLLRQIPQIDDLLQLISSVTNNESYKEKSKSTVISLLL